MTLQIQFLDVSGNASKSNIKEPDGYVNGLRQLGTIKSAVTIKDFKNIYSTLWIHPVSYTHLS